MPMDGLTVGFAVRELGAALCGGRIDRVYQPEKNTVILQIRAGGRNSRLLLCASPENARLQLTDIPYANPPEPSAMCMLMRKLLQGGRLLSVTQPGAERVAIVEIENSSEMLDKVRYRLVLEMMGRYSNLIIVNGQGKILEAARHVSADMNRIRQVQPGMDYTQPPGQGKLNPWEMTPDELRERLDAQGGCLPDKALLCAVSGLSPSAAKELTFRVLAPGEAWSESAEDKPAKLCELFARLPGMADPRVLTDERGNPLDFFAFPYLSLSTDCQVKYRTLSAAMDASCGIRDDRERLKRRSSDVQRILKNNLERCEKKLALQEEELRNAARMEEYRRMGELLNANLYQLKKGMEEAVLPDWNNAGSTVTVPLDATLTPVQNAQMYFKKYKKARAARETAASQREKTLADIAYLESMQYDISHCTDEAGLEETRQELARTGYIRKDLGRTKRKQRTLPPSRPMHYVSSDGLDVYVGKNAVQNDRLTASAKPYEWWLHVKDMHGSHVIVRTENELPERTLREAALLAVWHSGGRDSSSVPVDYTRKKFVKKVPGAAPGMVIYTDQHTLYLTADEAETKKIKIVDD